MYEYVNEYIPIDFIGIENIVDKDIPDFFVSDYDLKLMSSNFGIFRHSLRIYCKNSNSNFIFVKEWMDKCENIDKHISTRDELYKISANINIYDNGKNVGYMSINKLIIDYTNSIYQPPKDSSGDIVFNILFTKCMVYFK